MSWFQNNSRNFKIATLGDLKMFSKQLDNSIRNKSKWINLPNVSIYLSIWWCFFPLSRIFFCKDKTYTRASTSHWQHTHKDMAYICWEQLKNQVYFVTSSFSTSRLLECISYRKFPIPGVGDLRGRRWKSAVSHYMPNLPGCRISSFKLPSYYVIV